MPHDHSDIARITLNVLFIGGLLLGSFLIVQHFLPAMLWATTLVLATWPLMLLIERRVGGRRWLATTAMILVILLTLIVPLWLAVGTVVANLDVIRDLLRLVLSMRLPAPPDWLAGIPLIGEPATSAWAKLGSADVTEIAATWLTPYAGVATRWLASAMGGLGGLLVQLLLATMLAAVLYMRGEVAARFALRFGRRLAGDRGERAMRLAGQAVRAVALGVVVTAIVQSVVGGIGLAVAGVDFAVMLTALMFILCLVQLGPGLVLFPAVIWLFYSGEAVRGTVLLAFSILAVTIDQFVRPVLIRRGADLPILLILAGVIGGLIAFGLLGIFIGPTLLAVAYTLLAAWVAEGDPAVDAAAPR